jgi:hypothetical protein
MTTWPPVDLSMHEVSLLQLPGQKGLATLYTPLPNAQARKPDADSPRAQSEADADDHRRTFIFCRRKIGRGRR